MHEAMSDKTCPMSWPGTCSKTVDAVHAWCVVHCVLLLCTLCRNKFSAPAAKVIALFFRVQSQGLKFSH